MADPNAQEHWQKDAAGERPQIIVTGLIHNELILKQVFDIVMIDRVLVKDDPSDMAIPKTPFGVMGVLIGVRKLMMLPVLRCPAKR